MRGERALFCKKAPFPLALPHPAKNSLFCGYPEIPLTQHLEKLVSPRQEKDIEELLAVWDSSVRATHDFLAEADIAMLTPFVRQGLREIPVLYAWRDERGTKLGFMGTDADKLEMLFLHPEARGKGIGGRMLDFAVRELSVRRLDVNEQNPAALAFYRHAGFIVTERSALDDMGNPWPLLRMRLEEDYLKNRD